MPLLRLSGLDALISFFIIFLKVEDCYVGALTGILNCIFHTYTPYVQLCRAFMSILFLYTYVLDFFFFFKALQAFHFYFRAHCWLFSVQ